MIKFFEKFKMKNIEPSNVECKIIDKKDFELLRALFPDNDSMWEKYKKIRMAQYSRKEIDIFILEYKNQIIGELSVNYANQNLKTETIPKKRVYLEAFRINKKYQGHGLGQKLLKSALEHLKRMGYTEATIGVEENNKIAKHIYNKFGFTEAIDKGKGTEFDSSEYTLYLKKF